MKTVCQMDACTGCMACLELCPAKAIHIEDSLASYNAVIDETLCIHCDACHKGCQNNNEITYQKPYLWKQGWAADHDIRKASSSGGVATEIARSFVRLGGVVCSCVFSAGEFSFAFAVTEDDVGKFTGSKYVKSAPRGIYRKLKELLTSQKKVLFIGLPCQVSAVKLFVGERLRRNLYTIDLICHGTPSPRLLRTFLNQYGVDISEKDNIMFRNKGNVVLQKSVQYIDKKNASDRYTIAFLHSLIFTDNCYQCAYAKEERVSDLTLGDSWGSELSTEEKQKGISLVLCQSKKGEELLQASDLFLTEVSAEKAVQSNHQLEHPSPKPPVRMKFFRGMEKGKKFNTVVFRCYPKQCVKQRLKGILSCLKVYKGAGIYRISVQEKTSE